MAQLALVENATPELQADFSTFWLVYPRKEARKDAAKAWTQMDPADHLLAVEAIIGWRRAWASRETQYIPLAASWLRGERYHDELPRGVTVSAAAHQQFTPDAPRSSLSQAAKDAIAKIAAQQRSRA